MPEQPRNRLTDMIEEELAPLELDHWEPEWTGRCPRCPKIVAIKAYRALRAVRENRTQ